MPCADCRWSLLAGDHSSAKTRRLRGNDGVRSPCLIPDEGLPPVVVHTDEKGGNCLDLDFSQSISGSMANCGRLLL